MNLTDLGQLGLTGWRKKAFDRVADPVAARTPWSPDQLRAVLGAVFFGLAVYYLVSTVQKAAKQVRAGGP